MVGFVSRKSCSTLALERASSLGERARAAMSLMQVAHASSAMKSLMVASCCGLVVVAKSASLPSCCLRPCSTRRKWGGTPLSNGNLPSTD